MEANHSEKIQVETMEIVDDNQNFEDFDNVPMEELEFNNQIDFEKATVENV